MTTLRWLHLSDFHTGKDGYGQSRLFQYVLEHVRSRIASDLTPDFVFITGDIANKGLPTQYQEFNESFLLPLIDLLPPEVQNRVYLIPGNHDVDRNQTRAVQTYDVLLRVPEFFDPTEQGQFERRQSVFPRFQAFADNDMTNNGEHWMFSQEGTLSQVVPLSDKNVGVMAINTAWLSYSDNDRHQMSCGKPLLENGLEKIRGCDVKFILGHHPLDWFLDSELEPVRSLLGRQNIVYLHGHMHKGHGRYEEGAGYTFLDLQSGACFQAREHDLWVNRFLWGEMSFPNREISIEPLQWSRDHHEWTLDAFAFPEKYRNKDRWVLHLPVKPIVPSSSDIPMPASDSLPKLPDGWVKVDAKYLKDRAKELTNEQALSFFDGRTPIWREALAPQIPRREIVHKIVKELENAKSGRTSQVTVLIGAAGEGKTTALLQSVCDLVLGNTEWHVLWHYDTNTPLPAEFIARLPQGEKWLIVSDDAEMIARRVYEAAQSLRGRQDIFFLLCCRDTDWKASEADKFDWKHYIKLVEIPLQGLRLVDAERVVIAWGKYGADGLKGLSDVPLKEACERLLDASKTEDTNQMEGTFFGAILHVRLGEGLKEHIDNLLRKLGEISIGEGRTLKDAFVYIAAMHAENLQFLSKEVLAGALNFSLNNLKRDVLIPLGEEAAIATTGRFIYTRHQAIATTAIKILSNEIDTENIFVDLVVAARQRRRNDYFVPNLTEWEFLSSHFFNKGDHALGIRLAQAALTIPGNESHLIPKLAQLYRDAGQPELSVKVFHDAPQRLKEPRGYYHEWSMAEGHVENQSLSVWLGAFSISDEVAQQPPDNERTGISLASIAHAFTILYNRFNADEFIDACGSSAQLGLLIRNRLKPKTTQNLKHALEQAQLAGVKEFTKKEAFSHFIDGIERAWNQREDELPEVVTPGNRLHFRGMARLLDIDYY